MLNRFQKRLIVSIDEIRTHNREIADGYGKKLQGLLKILIPKPRLLNTPFEYSQAFNQALKNVIQTLPNRTPEQLSEEAVRLSAD